MARLTVLNNYEPPCEIVDALHVAADALGVDVCWFYRGGFHFRLPADMHVSITPETAGRLRVETWWNLQPRDRKWAMSDDLNRVSWLVRDALNLARQLA